MSVRLRVTLAFTAVMALVLVAAGLFLYLRLGAELDAGIRRTLESRSADITALVARSGRLADSERDAVAQVLDPAGRVTDATHEAGSRPWLTPAETRRALRRPLIVDHQHGDDHLRLRAVPASGGVVVVGGTSTTARGRGLEPRHAAADRRADRCCCSPRSPATAPPQRRCGRSSACAARAAEIQAAEPGARLPVAAGRRRDRAARRDAERDARRAWRRRSRASARSSPTRATSCARRSRSSRPSSSSRCAAAARARS